MTEQQRIKYLDKRKRRRRSEARTKNKIEKWKKL